MNSTHETEHLPEKISSLRGIDALWAAIRIAGSQQKLGKAVGVAQPTISQWIRFGRVPAEWVYPISQATGGLITCHQLRPDRFPPDPVSS